MRRPPGLVACAPTSGSCAVRHSVACTPGRCATRSTTSCAICRYVVSLPPTIVSMPFAASSITLWRRERSDVGPSPLSSSGRNPA